MEAANEVKMEETDQLLGNRNEGKQAPKRVLFVTGDMSLAELKKRARKYKVTINDWFLTSIPRAL